MNFKMWAVFVFMLSFCVTLVLWIANAGGQGVVPYSRMGPSDKQIAACAEFFTPRKKVETGKVPCNEIQNLWMEYCQE